MRCHFSLVKNKLLTSHPCLHLPLFLLASYGDLLERAGFLSELCYPPFSLVPSNWAFTDFTFECNTRRSPFKVTIVKSTVTLLTDLGLSATPGTACIFFRYFLHLAPGYPILLFSSLLRDVASCVSSL